MESRKDRKPEGGNESGESGRPKVRKTESRKDRKPEGGNEDGESGRPEDGKTGSRKVGKKKIKAATSVLTDFRTLLKDDLDRLTNKFRVLILSGMLLCNCCPAVFRSC